MWGRGLYLQVPSTSLRYNPAAIIPCFDRLDILQNAICLMIITAINDPKETDFPVQSYLTCSSCRHALGTGFSLRIFTQCYITRKRRQIVGDQSVLAQRSDSAELWHKAVFPVGLVAGQGHEGHALDCTGTDPCRLESLYRTTL